jgi:hypothetical protein
MLLLCIKHSTLDLHRHEHGSYQRKQAAPAARERRHMDSSGPLLVSNDRAMHLLGVGRTTLYEPIGQGELDQVHIGRRSLITTKSIAAYVDRLSQATA